MSITILALFDSSVGTQQTIEDLIAVTSVDKDDITIVAMDANGQYGADPLADADRSQLLTDAIRLGLIVGAGVGGLIGGLSSVVVGGLSVALSPVLAVLCGVIIGGLLGMAGASLIGGMTTLGASDSMMHMYGEGLQRGAVLIGVVVQNAAVLQVESILREHGGDHIQKRRGAWRRIHHQPA